MKAKSLSIGLWQGRGKAAGFFCAHLRMMIINFVSGRLAA